MGVEGWISIARVERGEYIIAPEFRVPQFVVREPVVVLPLFADSWECSGCQDGRHLQFDFRRYDRIDYKRGGMPLVVLDDVQFGLLVLPRRLIPPDVWKDWQELPPGAEPLCGLERAWERIVPGRWVVQSYETSEGVSWSCPLLQGEASFGACVAWEIWT